jgi:hypothetical protein
VLILNGCTDCGLEVIMIRTYELHVLRVEDCID